MRADLPPRRLIPRWRKSSSTLALPEAASISKTNSIRQLPSQRDRLMHSVGAWKDSPTAGHFGDVLACAVDPDCLPDVTAFAIKAIDDEASMTKPQRAMVNNLLGLAPPSIQSLDVVRLCNENVQRDVKRLRSILRVNPANPLALLDYAQLQVAAGKSRDAERSLRSALTLAPNNRLALRTVARFHVHSHDAAQAHQLLRRHPRTEHDPWLMASEIATASAAGEESVFASRGRRILKEGKFAPAQISELAGAIAGLEMKNGNLKSARNLFRQALLFPNDNVIAQAVTDRQLLGIEVLPDRSTSTTSSSAVEAAALDAWQKREVSSAGSNAMRWHLEEPFSSRPLQFLASVFSVGRLHEEARVLALRGLTADPNDASLTASLAYSLAAEGRLTEAEEAVRRLIQVGGTAYMPYAQATLGLIAMRQGLTDQGDSLYLGAIDAFARAKNFSTEAVCRAYYARAANDTGHPDREKILKAASDAVAKHPSPDGILLLSDLGAKEILGTTKEPGRRLYQWVLDPVANALIRREGVTEPGAPALVIEHRNSDRRNDN
ncbi:MAG: hypothetical protein ABIW82_17345 [Dokdonella sp.]